MHETTFHAVIVDGRLMSVDMSYAAYRDNFAHFANMYGKTRGVVVNGDVYAGFGDGVEYFADITGDGEYVLEPVASTDVASAMVHAWGVRNTARIAV